MWLGPAYAMIQDIYPSEIVGTATALFGFSGGIAGAISNILLGLLGDAFNTEENSRVAGYLLTGAFGISYLGCAPLFIIVGFMFKKFVFNERRDSLNISSVTIKEENINSYEYKGNKNYHDL